MKLKNFKDFTINENFDFDEIVQNLDLEWSETGMTSDAQDMFDTLVKKYGPEHKLDIKSSIEDFYEIDL